MNSSSIHRAVGIGVFAASLVLYMKTMAPSVSFWDTGEFIATAYTLSVPHPPGSPLYVLLGRLFSMLPLMEVAWRVVLMSAVSSALAVWCTYLSTAAIARRALGGDALRPFGDDRDHGVMFGSAVAAFTLAVSYTFWFNATEAEVYGYSILFVALGVWLVLYWEGTQHGAFNDRWLYLVAYVFGLGGGMHLLCLLTIPCLIIFAWFADRGLRRLITIMIGGGLEGFFILALFAEKPESAKFLGLRAFIGVAVFYAYVWATESEVRQTVLALLGAGAVALAAQAVFGEGVLLKLVLAAAGAALLHHLYQRDRRALALLIGAGILFAIGYSTYGALYVRSGLNPVIDENDPETWDAFMKFLNREQYGTDSMLLTMLNERAPRSYQLWQQQMKYFFQQFPFPLFERDVLFRWATGNVPHLISVSLVPYLLGLGGAIWHARRDWRRFAALMVMFLVMGFGLSFYLNMQDPQPRERHYVFGGMFYAFALWIGLGWTGILEALRQRWQPPGKILLAGACFGLLLPFGIGVKSYHSQDRTGDYIAYDYAYNLLNSVEPDGVLFTNGDNDTFPLWFLQEVEGVRRDIRVVNLSLLNTSWYIKQLRDREPKLTIPLNDTFIDSVLCDTQLVDLYKRLWREPKTPKEFVELGLDVKVSALKGHDLLRIQDIMVIGITSWNEWKRPIHFAITVAGNNRVGLDPYLRMMGMTMKVVPEKGMEVDPDAIYRNLTEVYRFRGIADAAVFKDDNTERLLGNYRACFMTLAGIYQESGQLEELTALSRWAAENIPLSWETFYTASEFHRDVGLDSAAAGFVEEAADHLFESYGVHPTATYDNALALASILLNSYRQYESAERVYRRAIELKPERYDGYHELAATFQAAGRVEDAVHLVNGFVESYGRNDSAENDLRTLVNAQNRSAAPEPDGTPPVDE